MSTGTAVMGVIVDEGTGVVIYKQSQAWWARVATAMGRIVAKVFLPFVMLSSVIEAPDGRPFVGVCVGFFVLVLAVSLLLEYDIELGRQVRDSRTGEA